MGMGIGDFIEYNFKEEKKNIVKFDYIEAFSFHKNFTEIILKNNDVICSSQIIKIYDEDETIFL